MHCAGAMIVLEHEERPNQIMRIAERLGFYDQASAVIAHEPVPVAFGLGSDGSLQAGALTEMKADQVWAVVDATRKHADTEAWVKKVGWSAPVQALAVINSQDTKTPETVNELGLPIRWIDGRKARRSAL